MILEIIDKHMIDNDILKNFESLVELDVSRNDISDIPENIKGNIYFLYILIKISNKNYILFTHIISNDVIKIIFPEQHKIIFHIMKKGWII